MTSHFRKSHNLPQELVRKFPLISDQIDRAGMSVLLGELGSALAAPGDVVEFGCYTGTTSLFIRRMLDDCGESAHREFHVYDSFAGLPNKSDADQSPAGTQFKTGELHASKRQFVQNFRAAQLALPIIHKNWFENLKPSDVPERISFAFLDGDFYNSILSSLELVWPRMQPDGRIVIDDYQREALPGATRAVSTFFAHKPTPKIRKEHNFAIIDIASGGSGE